MSLAVVYSRARVGLAAPLVTIEVQIAAGLPSFTMVGLPETAVRESKHRVRSALTQAQFKFPPGRITVNLAPADLPKEGGRFDLPMALGILAATEQIPADDLAQYEMAGELSLSGEVRYVQGCLPFALQTKQAKRQFILPQTNAQEASLSDCPLLPAQHLLDVCAHFQQSKRLPAYQAVSPATPKTTHLDFADVMGQQQAKRVFEIAAAGQHNVLMLGPPGSGKTMLAERMPSILPPLQKQEAIETMAVYSISGQAFDLQKWGQRPVRCPHHTASAVSLVGGGSVPKPGEISLAHHGILFLDEFPEFSRKVIETLREPLESGKIHIARAAQAVQFPAKFQLICAMNPCPCGYLGAAQQTCTCTQEQIQRYQARISGPILDRIDCHVSVNALPAHHLLNHTQQPAESSQAVRQRVIKARNLALARADMANAKLNNQQMKTFCALDKRSEAMLVQALEKFNLSARSYYKILKVARTIADLAAQPAIQIEHLQEALQYRSNRLA